MAAHPYAQLVSDYEGSLSRMQVTDPHRVEVACDEILKNVDRYVEASAAISPDPAKQVPAALIGALDYRESDCNPRTGLGQGDPWNAKSTHVPKGYGPFKSWIEAAVFYIHYDHLDDNSAPWSMPYACWKGEIWNGFGPRNHGRHTGYLWGCTSIYDGGKYVADGVWNPNYRDTQVGIVPIMVRLTQLRPALMIARTPVIAAPSIVPAQVPAAPAPAAVSHPELPVLKQVLAKLVPDLADKLVGAQVAPDNFDRYVRTAIRMVVADSAGLLGDHVIPALEALVARTPLGDIAAKMKGPTMSFLQNLLGDVAGTTDLEAAATKFLTGFAQQALALVEKRAMGELSSLFSGLKANPQAIVGAIVANTPAATQVNPATVAAGQAAAAPGSGA